MLILFIQKKKGELVVDSAVVDYNYLLGKKNTYTTKDIKAGGFYDVPLPREALSLLYAEIPRDEIGCNVACLIYKDKWFYSCKYNFQLVWNNGTPDTKAGYDRVFTPNKDTWRKDDLFHYGYHYNMMDCYYRFLQTIEPNSFIINERGGERSAANIASSLCAKDYFPTPSGVYMPMRTKDIKAREMYKQITDIIKEKNIFVDFREWYNHVVEHKVLRRRSVTYIKRWEGDLLGYDEEEHLTVYIDGYRETKWKRC